MELDVLDIMFRYFLPTLVWLVRHASRDDPSRVEAVRQIATFLLTKRSLEGHEEINVLVNEAGRADGTLRGTL